MVLDQSTTWKMKHLDLSHKEMWGSDMTNEVKEHEQKFTVTEGSEINSFGNSIFTEAFLKTASSGEGLQRRMMMWKLK